MTTTTFSGSFLLMMAAAVLPLAAQTTPKTTTTTTHRAATTTQHSASGCVTPAPELSPKIPALPASAPCVKTLYTVTHIPTMKLEYASPLVSPEVREELGGGPETYSLNYVDTEVGTGAVAKAGKWLSVHYTGYLTNGTKFDSSHDHPGGGQPISFPYGQHQVIPGWDTGFEGMHIGGKRRLFIPYQLAYGEQGKGPIPPKSELIFDVELIGQSETRPAPPAGARPSVPPSSRPGVPPAGMPPAGTSKPPSGASSMPQQTPPSGTSTAKPQN